MSNITKKSDYNIIFYGTPDFAVESLKTIAEAGYKIGAVVTVSDKPAGRGRKIQQSAVKRYALEQGYKILQPTSLVDEVFLSELKSIDADLQVVVAFRKLPEAVINSAKDGTINLHASLLPQYRGAAPINRAIMAGETQTGATCFFIDKRIDTGAVISQVTEEILPDDTAGSLHDKLMVKGAGLLAETINNIRCREFKAVEQSQFNVDGVLRKAPKIFKDDCYIDFRQDVFSVYNFIRGLAPYPSSRLVLKNIATEKEVVVFPELVKAEACDTDLEAGSIESNGKTYFKISASNGYIDILRIKVQGKKSMDIKSFLNGFDVKNYIVKI